MQHGWELPGWSLGDRSPTAALLEPFTPAWNALDTSSKWLGMSIRFWGWRDICIFITNVSDKSSIRLIAFLIVIQQFVRGTFPLQAFKALFLEKYFLIFR